MGGAYGPRSSGSWHAQCINNPNFNKDLDPFAFLATYLKRRAENGAFDDYDEGNDPGEFGPSRHEVEAEPAPIEAPEREQDYGEPETAYMRRLLHAISDRHRIYWHTKPSCAACGERAVVHCDECHMEPSSTSGTWLCNA
jgi:hypothetical protein